MKSLMSVASIVLIVGSFGSHLPAAGITISTADGKLNPLSLNQGSYSLEYPQDPTFDAYGTGFFAEPTIDLYFTLRGFFSFDLSSVANPVASAKLRILQSSSTSPDAIETIGVYEVTTPAAVLTAKNSTDPGIFADLGSGALYATKEVIIASPPQTVLSIDLNANGVAAINGSLGGYFSVGTALLTLSDNPAGKEIVFGPGKGVVNFLDLTFVPEPSTGALLACCMWVPLSRRAGRRQGPYQRRRG